MRVLFICSGNTCRSPMAEGFCKSHKPDWSIESAGLSAYPEQPASENAVRVLLEDYGIDISGHLSRQVKAEFISAADKIFGVTHAHVDILKEMFPNCYDKIFLLGEGIEDPYGGTLEVYRRSAKKIMEAVERL